ncbi:MAG: hypothetical protein LBL46_04390 [Rickettsiales bacterium]|jgi:hypothetical protein|nr:hypothetical protein [Rickettsiales bacterium]
MFNNIGDASRALAGFSMESMPLEVCAAVPKAYPADWFPKFREARRAFVAGLADAIPELALLNLSQEDFMDLMSGRRIPENLSIKWRRPILYGGEIAPENMFMLRTFPFGSMLDIFMTGQFGQGEIYYPNPAKKVWMPLDVLSGNVGGNATSDRLAQGFAASAMDR